MEIAGLCDSDLWVGALSRVDAPLLVVKTTLTQDQHLHVLGGVAQREAWSVHVNSSLLLPK
jgi:hypothetical protein